MHILSHGCTLDCFDTCRFKVYVENGQVVKIEGDSQHPYTKGLICSKGKKHLARLTHQQRITTPLKKVAGQWVAIDFTEALDIISQKLLHYKAQYGSAAVMHYTGSGSGGVLKQISDIFFNFFGGVTLTKGNVCWGAGIQAQKYDFGEPRGHFLEDMLNAKNIIIWGRNPANTSMHLMQMLKEAQKSGIKIIVIDPLYTETAKSADLYLRINPSTDGALAMAMTKVIIAEGLADEDFIAQYVKGFTQYKEYLDSLDLSYLADETGISIESIRQIARLCAKEKPTAIYPGYGLQKYRNGGNSIRAIDALGAIAGNIGRQGGGVNYANKIYPESLNLDPYNSNQYAINNRYGQLNNLSNFIAEEYNPPIKALFVSKANPLAQWPNLHLAEKTLAQVEFKVCIDMFMTDTAEFCDLFIPCTNTLESEDIVYTSMTNPYITYNQKAVEPKHKLMDEYYFFQQLALKMGLPNYPIVDKAEYLAKVIEPLQAQGIDLAKIQKGYVTIQETPVAWANKIFKTPSGKFELFSELAQSDGLSPFPIYAKSMPQGHIRLLSSHPKNSIFSQHYLDVDGMAKAFVNACLAAEHKIIEGEKVILKSNQGEIEVQIEISASVPDHTVHMYTGWWKKHGNPNFLTAINSSEMGGQLAYNETFIEIVRNRSV